MSDYGSWRPGEPVKPETDYVSGFDKRVALTHIDHSTYVSTVFLFSNHQYTPGGPGIWFETMAFGCPCPDDDHSMRYSTEEEARAGHEEVVKAVQRHIAESPPVLLARANERIAGLEADNAALHAGLTMASETLAEVVDWALYQKGHVSEGQIIGERWGAWCLSNDALHELAKIPQSHPGAALLERLRSLEARSAKLEAALREIVAGKHGLIDIPTLAYSAGLRSALTWAQGIARDALKEAEPATYQVTPEFGAKLWPEL